MVILEMFGSIIFDAPVTPRGSELDLTGYNLVFEDEFNGNSLDYTKWEHWREGVYGPGYLADSQVEVKDGALTLSAEYLENGKFGPGWYAADIQLKEKYKCGYFEIKCIIIRSTFKPISFTYGIKRFCDTFVIQIRNIFLCKRITGFKCNLFIDYLTKVCKNSWIGRTNVSKKERICTTEILCYNASQRNCKRSAKAKYSDTKSGGVIGSAAFLEC